MSKPPTVILTGISSFVGCHVGCHLQSLGLRVIGTHSRPLGSYAGLEAVRLAVASEAGVQLAPLDIIDCYAVKDIIHEWHPAWWIANAGWTKDHANNRYDLVRANTLHLAARETTIQTLKENGARGLIATGSAMEYSREHEECREDQTAWPETPYGLAKLAQTIRLKQLAEQYDFPIRVLRLFSLFGPLDSENRLIQQVTRALIAGQPVSVGPEEMARDFLSIRDVATAYGHILKDLDRPARFDLVNVCAGESFSLGKILRLLARQIGADPALIQFNAKPLRAGEPLSQHGNNEKIQRLTSWRPRVLEAGLADYVATLRNPPPAVNVASKPPLVRLSRSSIGTHTVNRVTSALRAGFLGMGPEVGLFERELSQYMGGQRQVVCVNTGTAALHLALQACGIGPGDEVLVPTLTFVASFQAISATGATPVACDVCEADGWLDPADVARRITPRTKAIMPVHYASGQGRLDEIYALAQHHGLRVIEDAAHAFGGTWKGQRVGATGDVVCFSFDGIKNITSGEGGAVVTSDPHVTERVRDARLLGVEKDTDKRYAGQRSWDFDVKTQGWRCHMSSIFAALGRAQLRRLDSEFAPRRVQLARRYVALLAGVPGVRHLNLDYGAVVPHIFPVFISDGKRDAVRAALQADNIETGIHYKPNHLLTLYGGGQVRLPVAEKLYAEMLTLPLHFELTDTEQDRVATQIVDVMKS